MTADSRLTTTSVDTTYRPPVQSPHQEPTPKAHDPRGTPAMALRSDSVNLDLVRAVAVMCVFFAHARDLITGTGAHVSWAFAQMGVLIFFVHTSLVLMMSLERGARHLEGRALALDFYTRRFFRIYPLSVLCVTAAFIGLVPTRAEPWPWSAFLSNLALTMNLTYTEQMWPVLWTLPLEVQMYLALPLFFVLLRGRALGWALALWGVAVLGGVIQPYVSGRLSIARFAPCFVAGVIAWRLTRTVRPRWGAEWWPAAFVASWFVWLIADRASADPYRWIFCLVLGCMIPWFHDISWRPLVVVAKAIAKYSYGIYLSHFAIIVFALKFDGPERWLILVGLAAVVPVAMFHIIEQPMIDVGRHIAARMAARRSVSRQPDGVAAVPSPR